MYLKAVSKVTFSAALLLLSGAAFAEKVNSNKVTSEGGRYHIAMNVDLDAPLSDVKAVLNDFKQFHRINNSVKKTSLIPLVTLPKSTTRMKAEISMCALFFCKHLVQIQDMRWYSPFELRAVVVPEGSDFSYGEASWLLVKINAKQTRMYFQATLEPKFWIPPLIGPLVIESKMLSEAVETSQTIEYLATGKERPVSEKSQPKLNRPAK